MVIAGDNQHAACWRAAVGIAVLECVAGSINAGALAVPDAKHAIDVSSWIGFDLLRSK